MDAVITTIIPSNIAAGYTVLGQDKYSTQGM